MTCLVRLVRRIVLWMASGVWPDDGDPVDRSAWTTDEPPNPTGAGWW